MAMAINIFGLARRMPATPESLAMMNGCGMLTLEHPSALQTICWDRDSQEKAVSQPASVGIRMKSMQGCVESGESSSASAGCDRHSEKQPTMCVEMMEDDRVSCDTGAEGYPSDAFETENSLGDAEGYLDQLSWEVSSRKGSVMQPKAISSAAIESYDSFMSAEELMTCFWDADDAS
eukprot:jgi/Mesvir1/6536/Mv16798-RA.1